jgi:F-type H+-transporting ATPase subunit epsilon
MFKVEIISPDKKLFENENAQSVMLPGAEGFFQILSNHAPIISALKAGDIKITSNNGEEFIIPINGGVAEVNGNKMIVLAEQ